MAWEGYTLRLRKCNDFKVNGLFGRDKIILCPRFNDSYSAKAKN
jgi:hypothetical protein